MININREEREVLVDAALGRLQTERDKVEAKIDATKQADKTPEFDIVYRYAKLDTLIEKLESGEDQRNV